MTKKRAIEKLREIKHQYELSVVDGIGDGHDKAAKEALQDNKEAIKALDAAIKELKLKYRRDDKVTNAEALIQMLEEVFESDNITNYISCPYVHNPNCRYNGSKDNDCCTDCKIEWLGKEWED